MANANITFEISFDYSNDALVPSSYPNPSAPAISTVDKDFAKRCGWISAWGKELEGIDMTKQGGNAFEGQWLFTRKHINLDAQRRPETLVFNMDAMNFGDSPIVASVLLDNSTRMTAIVMKASHSGLSTQDIAFKMNCSLPYPADFAWAEHPQRPSSWSPVSMHAPHILNPEMTVIVKTSPDYVCHVVVTDKSGVVNVLSHPQSQVMANYGQYAAISSNANSAVAGIIAQAEMDGKVTFSKFNATSKISKTSSGSKSSQASAPIDATFHTSASAPKFVAPDEIGELPVLPKGFKWYSNMRGVLYIEENGQLYWPHEVFDFAQMYADLTAFQNQLAVEGVESKREFLETNAKNITEQIERVRVLFKYMESVGDGISLNSKAFGDFK